MNEMDNRMKILLSFAAAVCTSAVVAKSADGKTGRLLVADYCGKESEIVVDVKNAGALVSAEIFDHERDFVPALVQMKDGCLTLKKEIDGSAAFLVKFDLSKGLNNL